MKVLAARLLGSTPIHLCRVGTVAVLAGLTCLLNACFPVTQPEPLPSHTPTLTTTATPTILWFPPTATRTPLPSIVPSETPDYRPGIGANLLSDDFSEASHWLTGNMGKGTISISGNEISLVLTQPKGYLYSYRDEPTLGDFYLELTANPSLCAGLDEYGLLLRYNSPGDFYRFSLSCNGQTRLDKLSGGLASSPQPWLASISVPSAAPSNSRLGVWANGSKMRFFINGAYQFGVTDRTLPAGRIGVFVRSNGENAVTTSFSDLVIYQIQP